MSEARRRALPLRLVLILVTVACAWLTVARLRLSPDLSALFPDKGEAAAMARFARVFGGGDLAVVLVRGDAPAEVEASAREVADALREKPSVARVLDRAPEARQVDPMLAWAFAGPAARARLAEALTPEGMALRLRETRDLLLAPGSGEAEEWLAKDPLRLAAIPWESRAELAAGVRAAADGAFVTSDGRARLVVVQARGSAFSSASVHAFGADADQAMTAAHDAHPGVRLDLTGGHAIARATEAMLKRDLTVSGTLSAVLASLTFALTFRRVRALVAVLPPLALGTLWTTGLAAFWPGGLSAISIAFAAVVVGVGVDTGVHVYAALLAGRKRGLSPHEAARFARRETARPTMVAAIIAGLAFASLALSDLAAVGQLGILCGAGEVLTAVAILFVTPEIGAWLERKDRNVEREAKAPAWIIAIGALTATRTRAAIALVVCVAPVAAIFWLGWPQASDALVALRPRALAPIATEEAIYELFGGRPGQWVVLSIDANAEKARARADAVAEALDSLAAEKAIEGYDALTTFAPSETLQRFRLDARDALDLPARRAALAKALTEGGFDVEACAPAFEAFENPTHDVLHIDVGSSEPQAAPLAWLAARHLASDGADTIVATFVRPTGDPDTDAHALEALHAADPKVIVTGYAHLERALKASLARDLPRVALVSLGVAALGLGLAFRSVRDVVLALAAVLLELAAVAVTMRVLGLRWHVYDALVVPVLIGITLDESMFLLHAAREGKGPAAILHALAKQGPLVVCTALTTAAGFGALLACRFDGLVDLGAVGTLGVVFGLVSALVVVPAGLRLARGDGPSA